MNLNPKVAELAKQAGGEIVKSKQDFMHGCMAFTEQDLHRFTNLLVEKCIWEVVKDQQVPQNIQVLIGDRIREALRV